jgi:hypothetical protein
VDAEASQSSCFQSWLSILEASVSPFFPSHQGKVREWQKVLCNDLMLKPGVIIVTFNMAQFNGNGIEIYDLPVP